MTVRSPAVLVAAALAATAACAHGPMRGQLARPGQPPQPATLNYESSIFGRTGKLWTTLPGGETFTGPYALDPAAPDKSIATTLAGDRGNTLACRLTLVEPGVGPEKGGTVRCDLSSGGIFEARF